MKMSIKDKRAGAVNVYAVTFTVHVHAQSASDAESYVKSAIEDWAVRGKKIPSILVQSVNESNIRFHVDGVKYPTGGDEV
jgi:hypothetical protein